MPLSSIFNTRVTYIESESDDFTGGCID